MVGTVQEVPPDRPSPGGPATWLVLLVTGLVAAVVVGGIVGYRAWRSDDDTPDEAPAVVAAPSTSVDAVDVPADRLFTRTTASGIELRVDTGDGDAMGIDFGMPVDGDAPASCQVVGQVMATAISNEQVLQGWLPLTEEAAADPAPALLSGMLAMGPRAGGAFGVVLQVTDDAVNARLSAPGAIDEMAPVDGVVALAVTLPVAPGAADIPATTVVAPFGPGRADLDDVGVIVTYADGRVRQVRGDDLLMGPQIWRGDGECFGPSDDRPADTLSTEQEEALFGVHLPPPGVQPTDPAADRAAIEAVMASLYGAGDDDDVLALVDDPFAMRETLARIGDNDVGIDWTQTTATISELVFLSPVEVAFEYAVDVDEPGLGRDELFGRARLVDGAWRIGRGTVCRDLLEIFATACPP
jgi:hypothetical protein